MTTLSDRVEQLESDLKMAEENNRAQREGYRTVIHEMREELERLRAELGKARLDR